MEEQERPDFPASFWAQIEAAQIGVDQHFWERLLAFRAPRRHTITLEEFNAREYAVKAPEPKRPEALRMAIGEYALNLFAAEGQLYPDDPRLRSWYDKLAERIVSRILGVIADVESLALPGRLAYHGLAEADMRKAARDEVNKQISARLDPPKSSTPLPPEVEAQVNSPAARRRDGVADSSLVEHRRKLLAEYKLATGNPADLRIYTASNSGIYKPEFYQWKNGKLPEGSKITKRFEAFLKSKRRPVRRNPANL